VWIRAIPQNLMALAFNLPDVVSYSIDSRTVTGSISRITATSSKGKKVSLTGEVFRGIVKLPSAWFDDAKKIFRQDRFLDECSAFAANRVAVCAV